MKKYAVLIAVEEYADPELGKVAYARRDAEEFAAALELHGFAAADRHLLIDGDATKVAVERTLRETARRCEVGDLCYVYYAGRGSSNGVQNYLACHDTDDADWKETGLSLADLLRELEKAAAERVVLFLDTRHRRPGTNIDEQLLRQTLDSTEKCLCLAACGAEEDSHVSQQLHHSIWSYHLMESFRGDAPLALSRGLLTATSLQNYLQSEVPRTLLKTFSTLKEQTPWMRGAGEKLLLADLREHLKERREPASPGVSLLTEMSFTHVDAAAVKSLSGWKSGNRLPDRYSGASQSFVASCAADELKADLDVVYSKLKRAFGFTRRELQASELEDGAGTIITPHFNYSVTVALNPDELDEVVWTRTVDAIKSPAKIASRAFAEVFDGVFDTLEFHLPSAVNIEDFIDAVEAARIPGVKLEYDREATYCELKLAGTDGTVTLTPKSLAIVHDRPSGTQQLMASLDTVRKLVQKHQVPLI